MVGGSGRRLNGLPVACIAILSGGGRKIVDAASSLHPDPELSMAKRNGDIRASRCPGVQGAHPVGRVSPRARRGNRPGAQVFST